jgi:DNA-binding LacI/PurR family transcriptional regulator
VSFGLHTRNKKEKKRFQNLKRFRFQKDAQRMKLTIKDVARAAKVSVATASMALNNRSGISEKTKAMVCKIAQELNYVPDHSARSLVMQNSNCIGLMIPEIQNPFYSAIVDILTRIAEDKGYTLLLGISNSSGRQEAEYVKMFLSRRVCGVIVVPMLANHPDISHLEMLRAADVPMVFCTENYADCNEPLVMCDFASGQYGITKYLLDKGLRDFWFVSTDMDVQFARLRYEGFCLALNEAGLEVDKNRVLLLSAPRYQQAYEASDRIVDDLPQAVLCINDIMTMAIMKRMVERGLRIPRDVSVAGFDDVMFSELVSPPLTTVRQPLQAICEKAMEILEKKLASGADQASVEQGKVYLIEPQLVIRETTI